MSEILLAVLVLSGIGGLLALLLAVADKYIAAYGECKITVNGKREIKVTGGSSLLSSLMENKIFIPSACGGRGTCALCKVKVLEGGGPRLPVEDPYMTPEERESGVRLSCQVKVRNDISIEIPEELFSVRGYRARVERITDLTYDIKELRLSLIEPESIEFKAGQYIQLSVPRYEGNTEETFRAYSMSSPPQDNRAVETIIRLVPHGICTTWVFNHMKQGDEVALSGPYGHFYLRPTDSRIVFIAGGSGFAPIKSMLEGHREEVARRGARFFFGAKAKRDLFHIDRMRVYEAKHATFKFVPALSEPLPEDQWDGETGLITDVLDRCLKDASNTEFYLCGSPGMIDACVAVLRRKNVSEDLIFYDKFA